MPRGYFRGLALDNGMPLTANTAGRVQDNDVAVDQHVEQMADGGQVQVLSANRSGVLIEIPADVDGRDLVDG